MIIYSIFHFITHKENLRLNMNTNTMSNHDEETIIKNTHIGDVSGPTGPTTGFTGPVVGPTGPNECTTGPTGCSDDFTGDTGVKKDENIRKSIHKNKINKLKIPLFDRKNTVLTHKPIDFFGMKYRPELFANSDNEPPNNIGKYLPLIIIIVSVFYLYNRKK